MTRGKSVIITALAAILLFCVLYLSNEYAIRWFKTLEMVLAVYGYIQAVYVFYRWLREPLAPEEPKHIFKQEDQDMEPVADGNTIPKTWINPFKSAKEATE